jgi:hypothetical protein
VTPSWARHGGWLLAETWLPFAEGDFPVGSEATGRLVRVTVKSASRASFAERRGLLSHTKLAGEILLEGDQIRVTVFASAFSVLTVGGTAGIVALGGLRLFLGHPSLGTALFGGLYVAGAAWLAGQISKAGREIAADAAHILGVMARGEGSDAFSS